MKRIYLVRHGETQWNVEHRMQGHCDSPLTEKGKDQAEKLSSKLLEKGICFDKAFSSPSGRAFNTAEILLKGRNVDIQKKENLKEINLSKWEGKSREEVEQMDPEQITNFWKNPHLYNPSEGESFFQLQKRAVNEINHIFRTKNADNILVVSHAAFIKSLITYIYKRELTDLWKSPRMKNCSCFIICGNDIDDCRIIETIYPDEN